MVGFRGGDTSKIRELNGYVAEEFGVGVFSDHLVGIMWFGFWNFFLFCWFVVEVLVAEIINILGIL